MRLELSFDDAEVPCIKITHNTKSGTLDETILAQFVRRALEQGIEIKPIANNHAEYADYKDYEITIKRD